MDSVRRLGALAGAAPVVALVVAYVVAGLAGPASAAGPVVLPRANAPWDYQIGGAFTPAARVAVVSRDRRARPAAGRYNICYVNAFQTQPDERGVWRRHPGLILRENGHPVVDGAWDERLLDTRTPGKRQRLLRLERRWLGGCARAGYAAVELDNLDSWQRSDGLLTRADNVAFARLLVRAGHRRGLAVAQKNTPELGRRGPRIGFDFAITEDCARWHECGTYARAYHRRVFDVEYTARGFRRACRRWGGRLAVVRRNLEVTPAGVDRRC